MKIRSVLSIILLVMLLIHGRLLADKPEYKIPWLEIKQGDVTVKYQKEDAEIAKQMLPMIVKWITGHKDGKDPTEVESLKKNKASVLAFIADQLDLIKPTDNMGKLFDQCIDLMERMQKTNRKCRVFEIWHKDKYEQIKEPQEVSDYFVYSPEKQAFMFRIEDSKGKKDIYDPVLPSMPMMIMGKETPDELEKLVDMKLSGLWNPRFAGTLCHEVTEGTLTTDFELNGPFIRWFTEGTANYVAGKYLQTRTGQSEIDDFIKELDISKYKEFADKVDLLNWRMTRWDQEMPDHLIGKIVSAYYSYSYHEICELAKRHGEDTIRGIMRQIDQSDAKVRDDKIILSAIKKATGEDFAAVLGKYGKNAPNQYKGFAACDFKCKGFSRETLREEQNGRHPEGTPLIADGQHAFIAGFACVTRKTPLSFAAYLVQADKSEPSGEKVLEVKPTVMKLAYGIVPFTFVIPNGASQGEYTVRIFMENKPFKDMKIYIQKPGVQD